MAIESRDKAEIGLVRRIVPPLAAVIGLVIVAIGVMTLADRNAATNMLASIYESLGNGQGALDLRKAVATNCSPSCCLAWWPYSSASRASGCCMPASAPSSVCSARKWQESHPSVGLRCSGACPADSLSHLPDGSDASSPASPCKPTAIRCRTTRQLTSPQYFGHLPQQHHLADRGHAAAAFGLGLADRRLGRPGQARGTGQDFHLPAAGHLARRRIGHLAVHVPVEARGPAADTACSTPSGRDLAASRSAGSRHRRSTPTP